MLAGCDGSLSIVPVNETLAKEISIDAQLVGLSGVQQALAANLATPPLATHSLQEGQYLIVTARNRSAQGVWGELEVLLEGDERYRFRVPHLEPMQQSTALFVAYVGSGSSNYGSRPHKWLRLHGK